MKIISPLLLMIALFLCGLLEGETHSGTVSALAFSPDNSLLASGDSMGNLFFRDAKTVRFKRKIKARESVILHLEFSPDGKTLATNNSRTLELWDVATGTLKEKLPAQEDEIYSFAFSPDGSLIAIAISKYAGFGKVILWDLQAKRSRWTYKNDYRISSLKFSHDGKTLAVGTSFVDLLEVATGKQILRLNKSELTALETLVFTNDDRTLVGGSMSGKEANIYQWDIQNGELISEKKLSGTEVELFEITVSSDGKTIATSGGLVLSSYKSEGGFIEDKRVRLWDAQGNLLRTIDEQMTGNGAELAFSADSSLMAAGSGNTDYASQQKVYGDVKVWDNQSGEFKWSAK